MTAKEIAELREKRLRLVEQCRAIANKAQVEKRSLTAEEQTNYNKIFDEQRSLSEHIQREEQLLDAEREMTHSKGKQEQEDRTKSDIIITGGHNWGVRADSKFNAAFTRALQVGRAHMTPDELRDLSAGGGTQGGFLLTPQAFVEKLLKALDNMVFIRAMATKIPVIGSNSVGAPSLDADPSDADWTSEVPASTPSADTTMAFGKRELTPHALSKRIKLSNKLLRNTSMNAQDIVIQRLAYVMGITQEKAFMTGSGNNQPLGLFTANNMGIGTGRDMATGNEATSITFAGLVNAKYGIKSGYRANASWLFHRDGVKQVAGLTDDNGQFLWQPSKAAGEPDKLLGHAIMESEYAPKTFTTGQYVGMFGDYSYYWIADSLDLQIQILSELYAETNQTGYIARQESDGMPALAEAFSRIKLG